MGNHASFREYAIVACYTLLAFISIKMEIHWRSNPVGKVRYNLPSLRSLIQGNFTQSP